MTMLPFCETPQECGPDSLLDLCFKYVIQHLNIVCSVDPFTKDYHLIDGLALPRELCERLIEVYQKTGKEVTDGFANIFQNPHTTRLKRVRLRNSPITDDGLKVLLRHELVELDLSNCCNITGASLTHINEHGNSLVSLIFGSSVNILPETVVLEELRDSFSLYHKRGYVLRTPNLQRLAVRNVFIGGDKAFFQLLVRPLHKLVHLDLSNCLDLGPDLSYLTELKYLTSLVLHNVQRLQESLPSICQLKQLRHLDVSQASEKQGIFRNENQMLALLVESLPNLASLDISGTNLAGTGVAEHSPNSKDCMDSMPQTDIPGLNSRVNNPFEFLGLYGTHHAACRRHDIPARNIAGDLNEVQIFNAAAANIDRPAILQRVLNDLYHLFRYETCHDPNYAMKVVLEAMDRHLSEKHIQISGSATLFYIVKGKDRNQLDMKTKQMVIGTLLNGMNMYRDDDTMMRNGCLTLCQFRIPDDVLFDYRRLVSILLHIVSEMEQEGFVQRIGIYLLNSLACQVDGFQKQLLGDLGAISRMLGLIEDRLARRVCDDVLEVAWSTMWNVTDETAVNCKRFLDGGGMEFFLGCLSVFPEKEELLRNMMGLLGNVAEVQSLRPRLMTKQFVSVFAELLDSSSDGIEVSYNAAGVLSHMASDGPASWTLDCPRREDVLQRMVHAIERWDLDTERNINYRSFEPILHLAKMYHTPECQHWAVWALANLTKVYPAKYCYLVEAEGGLALLMEIIQREKPYMRIKELAMLVIRHCRQFKEKGYLSGDGQLDG